MLMEVVTFKLRDGMTQDELLQKFRDTAPKWRGVEDLVRKSFIYDADAGVGGGVYMWKTAAAADHWHGDEWRGSIRELYGSDPEVRRYDVAIVVDNELEAVIET